MKYNFIDLLVYKVVRTVQNLTSDECKIIEQNSEDWYDHLRMNIELWWRFNKPTLVYGEESQI